MLELLAGTGLGLASHMWETAFDSSVNDHYDAEHQRREFNYNQKNMTTQQINNLLNLQNSPSAYVQGLKRAGINPALAVSGQIPVGSSTALGTSGSGHAVPGTSSGTAGAMAALEAKQQMEVTESQVDLNEAAAAKNKAESDEAYQRIEESRWRIEESKAHTDESIARGAGQRKQNKLTQREIERQAQYDAEVDNQARALYSAKKQSAQTQAEIDYWDSLEHSELQYNKGMIQAQLDFASMLNSLDEFEKEAALRAMLKLITKNQLQDQKVISDLVHMPSITAQKTLAETADLWSSKKWRDWQRETLGPAQAELIGQQTEATEHGDIVGMAEDGNYLGVGLTLLPTLLNSFGLWSAARGIARKVSSIKSPSVSSSKSGTPSVKKGVDSNGRPAMSEKSAGEWARIQKLKFSDPAQYKSMVQEWHAKYDKK